MNLKYIMRPPETEPQLDLCPLCGKQSLLISQQPKKYECQNPFCDLIEYTIIYNQYTHKIQKIETKLATRRKK